MAARTIPVESEISKQDGHRSSDSSEERRAMSCKRERGREGEEGKEKWDGATCLSEAALKWGERFVLMRPHVE
jgi:hypothetical protein